MAPWIAEAASLGKITVLSSLGQPLRAEVEVGASREELAGMMVRLAPLDAFRQAGVDYASVLSDLRFTLDKRPSGTSVIRVTSNRPVNEPFLDFLVELNWPAGRLVREYTFLLDPPDVAAKSAGKAVSVAEARPVANLKGGVEPERTPAAKAAKEPLARTEPKPAAKPKAAEDESGKPEGGTRLVKQGDTLRKIASEAQYEGVSLEQMLIGLYRANSDAFVGRNINRMKAGAILNLPEKETVAAIPQEEARKVYLAQAADWNAYRRKLAAAAAQGPAKEEASGQAAGGKITAKVEEKAAPAESQKDQVKVARTDATGKQAAAGAGKQVAEEALVAKDKALKEAQERVALLEKNIADLQKLVEMKNQSLAELQKQSAAKKAEEQKPAVPAAKPAEPPKAPEPVKAAEEPKPAEAAKPAEAPKVEEAPKAPEPPKAPEAPKPPAVKKPVLPPEPLPEPSLVDDLMENPLPLAGGGGILALLLGYFLVKRRRKQSETLSMASPSSLVSLGPNSVFRSTGGQSVDTGNTTPQATDFSQTGPGTIDTDEVDPVAEADVYMAYGRDAQAEEILLEALQKDPHRTAIHAKLLEIYAGRKSLKQFETLASELYAQTGGAGPEWEKVAVMGARLDPANPLYSGGKAAPAEKAESFDAEATLIISPEEAAKAATVITEPAPLEAEPAMAAEPAPLPDLELSDPITVSGAMAVEEPKTAEHELVSLDFDLGSPVIEAAPAPVAPPAPEPAPAVAAPEVSALDFDLGLASDTAPALAVEAPEALETGSLDFDLDLGLSAEAAPAHEEPAPAVVEMSEPVLSMELAGAESLSVPAIDLSEPAESAAVSEAAEAGNALDFNFDIGVPAAEKAQDLELPAFAEAPAAVAEEVVDATALDAGGLEFDVQLSDAATLGETVESPGFDLGSIDLDLATDTPVEAPEGAEVAPAALEAVAEVAAARDPRWEEVNTKLDLAKAYEEMGDLEGARELLQEVMGEGSPDLADQARGILERLNA
ncbi:MAG: hypothetical protein H6R10_1246 [Rhodocyclaceae bacterium]|nr:hypothetical protein [Rhodocyclaceae bacterium]